MSALLLALEYQRADFLAPIIEWLCRKSNGDPLGSHPFDKDRCQLLTWLKVKYGFGSYRVRSYANPLFYCFQNHFLVGKPDGFGEVSKCLQTLIDLGADVNQHGADRKDVYSTMAALLRVPHENGESSSIYFVGNNIWAEFEVLRGNPAAKEVPPLSMYVKMFALLIENGYSAWNPTLDSPIVMMIATLYR